MLTYRLEKGDSLSYEEGDNNTRTLDKRVTVANVVPTATDDTTEGFIANKSIWIDLTTDSQYKCLDDTTDSAVWQLVTKALPPAEVKIAYESNTNTNAFTDADKAQISTNINGIDSNADAIANLSNTSARYVENGSISLTTSPQVLDFIISVPSNNDDVLSLDEVNNTVTFKDEARYNIAVNRVFEATTKNATTITINTINDADDSVIESKSYDFDYDVGVAIPVSTNLLIDTTGYPLPLVVRQEVFADSNDYDLLSFKGTIMTSGGSGDATFDENGNIVYGDGNDVAYSEHSYINGIDNTIDGAGDIVTGDRNNITGNNNLVSGGENVLDANNVMVKGSINDCTHNACIVIGQALKSSKTYSLWSGQFNTNTSTIELGIGNGADDANRSNLIELHTNGALHIDKMVGTTAQRPTLTKASNIPYYDTDLLKPIWFDGVDFRDATGLAV